jgi:cytochrome c peroxidase
VGFSIKKHPLLSSSLIKKSFWIGLLSMVLWACTKDPIQEPAQPIGPVLPSHFPPPHYTFTNNPISEAGIELGRRLFYDPILSLDSTISCGSCHAQVHAFADHNTPLSTGINGRLGFRNTPGLANLIWYPAFNWDGGVNHIEIFSVAPITDENEMGLALREAVDRLRRHDRYPQLFMEAFGVSKIETREMLYALTQFMGIMVSYQSKYDDFLNGKPVFSEKELLGYDLFQQNCATCHQGPLLTDFSYRNNGLSPQTQDEGRYGITKEPEDMRRFRVPSLRNVALTHPYLHNGSLLNLYQVVNAYSNGVTADENLDPVIPIPGFQFNEEEKEALVAFLRTLSDWKFISNHNLAEPRL